jgi:tetratricopeptide (TPR) repeat protein
MQANEMKFRRSFVHGRESLHAYMATGKKLFLEQARTDFRNAIASQELSNQALFYLGVAQTQLRETPESIKNFNELLEKQISSDLRVKTLIQLAYAHARNYTDTDFFAAQSLLQQALQSTRGEGDDYLKAAALQVWLFAVMGGRLDDKANLGTTLLDRIRTQAPEARFDVLNGLGIAFMRSGELQTHEDLRDRDWQKSEEYYKLALDLFPKAITVLQNLGTLRVLQYRAQIANGPDSAMQLLNEARNFYERSVKLNDQDQFPFSQLSKIAAYTGRWHDMRKLIATGMTKPGAVKAKQWDLLREVSEKEDARLLESTHYRL